MAEEQPKDELGIKKIATELQKAFGEKSDPNTPQPQPETEEDE